MRSRLKCSTTRCREAAPYCSRRSGEEASSARRDANVSASRGLKSQPEWIASITSVLPPTLVAITGKPTDMASRRVLDMPSEMDVTAKASMVLRSSGTSFEPPTKVTAIKFRRSFHEQLVVVEFGPRTYQQCMSVNATTD